MLAFAVTVAVAASVSYGVTPKGVAVRFEERDDWREVCARPFAPAATRVLLKRDGCVIVSRYMDTAGCVVVVDPHAKPAVFADALDICARRTEIK